MRDKLDYELTKAWQRVVWLQSAPKMTAQDKREVKQLFAKIDQLQYLLDCLEEDA